jgi:WD domain, G-beta repeat
VVGHSGQLTSVAFDSVDDLVAAGGADGTVPLWARARSEPVRTLPGNAEVRSVAFSKDGALLASGGTDNQVRLWDPHTGTLARPALIGPAEQVSSVAFSPVQHLVAAGSADQKIYVWDTDSGQLRPTITTPGPLGPVAFSPDGHRIVSGGDDNMVRVWDLASGQPAMGPLRDTPVPSMPSRTAPMGSSSPPPAMTATPGSGTPPPGQRSAAPSRSPRQRLVTCLTQSPVSPSAPTAGSWFPAASTMTSVYGQDHPCPPNCAPS